MTSHSKSTFCPARVLPIVSALLGLVMVSSPQAAPVSDQAKAALGQIDSGPGVCVVLGLPGPDQAPFVTDIARGSELVVYFQSPNDEQVAAVREAAKRASLLGSRVFAERGRFERVHLADNLAGAVLVSPSAQGAVDEKELLRVLHPRGKAIVGNRTLEKPFPKGTDSWSHPYHRPDNNPQSTDALATAPYLTQFLAEPMFAPMPEVSVAAGGRVFRAFGHISHKTNQNAMLNTLICVNAYNGAILWTRSLPEGFMIHRNTMVATGEFLYLADHRSCKKIDAATGKVCDQIVVPKGLSDGPVWKWMALVDGVLYALVGGEEIRPATQPSSTVGLGHWPWGMWEGHEYENPKTNFGFGRTLLAINPQTKEVLWSHREEEHIDGRGVAMRSGRIYFYSPESFLGCLDAKTGKPVWKNRDAELLEAIGPTQKAQKPITGYSTASYMKCNDDLIFFAGSQRIRLVAASTRNGSLVWQKESGNFQLVLRDDAIYAAGPQIRTPGGALSGAKLAYETGEVLANLPMRRSCTRATGSIDSIFYRASGGTVRIDTASLGVHHIAPMRPPCQDGVIISDGNLYWGPWMCGCQLSVYGHIGLSPAGSFDFRPKLADSRLETHAEVASVKPFAVRPGDWPTYRANNARTASTRVKIPRRVTRAWSFDLPASAFPTAPIAAGGWVFFGDRNGTVRAIDADDGKLQWETDTGGAVFFPPAIEQGRLFVGSADGRVYAFEAATGRRLWTFHAAPAQRRIPVYGKLISTWPVAGGVVAEKGIVYAAAGIAHYDGTHVYALDAASGKVRWHNDTSGTTSKTADHGISLQGSLSIRSGELRFLGGGVHEEARYDLATGKCLNEPTDLPRSTFHTAFYAYFPHYGGYVSLDHTRPDGTQLVYDATYDGSWHGGLMLLPPLAQGAKRPPKPISRWGVQRRRGPKAKPVWQAEPGRRFNSFLLSDDVLLAAGHLGTGGAETSFLGALDPADGSHLWVENLPGRVVKAGTAINREGQIFVALENGRILAFSPAK